MRKTPNQLQRGFSLLEVLIALAIMVVSVTTILGTQTAQVLLSERGEYMSTAVMLARQKLADVELSYRANGLPGNDLEDVQASAEKPFGDDYPEFGYTLSIKRVLIPIPKQVGGDQEVNQTLAASSGAISNFLSQAVREVRLQVTWETAFGKDQIEIVTHLVDLNASLGI